MTTQLDLFTNAPIDNQAAPAEAVDLNTTRNPYLPGFDAPLALDPGRGPDGLTGKERFVVAAVLEGQDAAQAASSAGYTSPAMGQVVLARPQVQGALMAALGRAGLDEPLIALKIQEGLDAERPVVCDKSIDLFPDHSARHRYLTTLLELRGDLSKKNLSDEDSFEAVLFAVRAKRSALARGTTDEDPQPCHGAGESPQCS